jgi:hypothetical protein
MIKKKFNDGLFDCLNWILKKTIKDTSSLQFPSSFIISRWLSMADPSIAQIINSTTNRWINKTESYRDGESFAKLYRILLPRYTNKINYIKKIQKETTNQDNSNLNIQMEISQRELDLYNQTLDEIKEFVK